MKTVYFVRHGESEANTGNHIHGDDKSPLTERGREQARRIAERCSKLPVDIIIASTMTRAQETAEAIAKETGVQVELSDLFRERKMPASLMGNERRGSNFRKLQDDWTKTLYTEGVRLEDGESFSDIKERAGKALSFLETRAESNILVVAHGFIIRMILARVIFGKDVTPDELLKIVLHMKVDNTGITMLHFDPEGTQHYDYMPIRGWFVRVWNDHVHLG